MYQGVRAKKLQVYVSKETLRPSLSPQGKLLV